MSDADRLIEDDEGTEHYQLFGIENEASNAADGVEFLPDEEVGVWFKVKLRIINYSQIFKSPCSSPKSDAGLCAEDY